MSINIVHIIKYNILYKYSYKIDFLNLKIIPNTCDKMNTRMNYKHDGDEWGAESHLDSSAGVWNYDEIDRDKMVSHIPSGDGVGTTTHVDRATGVGWKYNRHRESGLSHATPETRKENRVHFDVGMFTPKPSGNGDSTTKPVDIHCGWDYDELDGDASLPHTKSDRHPPSTMDIGMGCRGTGDRVPHVESTSNSVVHDVWKCDKLNLGIRPTIREMPRPPPPSPYNMGCGDVSRSQDMSGVDEGFHRDMDRGLIWSPSKRGFGVGEEWVQSFGVNKTNSLPTPIGEYVKPKSSRFQSRQPTSQTPCDDSCSFSRSNCEMFDRNYKHAQMDMDKYRGSRPISKELGSSSRRLPVLERMCPSKPVGQNDTLLINKSTIEDLVKKNKQIYNKNIELSIALMKTNDILAKLLCS